MCGVKTDSDGLQLFFHAVMVAVATIIAVICAHTHTHTHTLKEVVITQFGFCVHSMMKESFGHLFHAEGLLFKKQYRSFASKTRQDD